MYGRPSWSPPVVVNCRWEDVSNTFTDGGGQQQRSRSRIYVDRRLAVGDFIAKGVFTDVDPYEPDESAKEIRDFREISNVLGDRTEYRVLI